jgi:hypothetical protein
MIDIIDAEFKDFEIEEQQHEGEFRIMIAFKEIKI